MNLLLLGAIGAGLYLVSQSGTKKPSASNGTSSKVPVDKGFTVIIPCKMYDIYNEEASYEYAFAITRNNKSLSVFQVLQKVLEGCDESSYKELAYSSKYYAWIYRIYRAILKGILFRKTIITEPEISAASDILIETLESLSQAGLSIENLPAAFTPAEIDLKEGNFQQ